MADLPDFEAPPVVETVLGIQFTPLTKFGIPHFGEYWSLIKSEYRDFEVRPPIVSTLERLGQNSLPREQDISIELVGEPDIRCWFIDDSKNNLLQLQRDRFILNWRKHQEDEKYPHYKTIRPKFKTEWLRFCKFLAESNLGRPEVNQCEVTYVNHIEFDDEVRGFSDLDKIIPAWAATNSGTFLPKPDKVLLNAIYPIKDKKGRLTVSLQPVLRSRDSMEVIQLNLSATGRPSSSEIEDVLEWLDLGQEWIVRGFTDFTTPTMHQKWGRKNDRSRNLS